MSCEEKTRESAMEINRKIDGDKQRYRDSGRDRDGDGDGDRGERDREREGGQGGERQGGVRLCRCA